MTPAERARLIDQQEFERECAEVRQRALQYAEQKRRAETTRMAKRIGREVPQPRPRVVNAGPKAKWIGRETPSPRPHVVKGGRQAKLYTHNGERRTLAAWAAISGIKVSTLRHRVRSGMDFTRALSGEPLQRTTKLHTINGVSKTLSQWAEHAGITYNTLMQRMSNGRTLSEAISMSNRSSVRVVGDFEHVLGTGAGSFAQDSTHIDFSTSEISE